MIREVTPADAPAIRAIYAPYVEETNITFELEVPAVEEVRERIDEKRDYPWFVCERDGEVVGYAYGGPIRKRAAYRWAVETSVYVRAGDQELGVGRALYTALLDCLQVQGYQDAYAVITVPNPGSEAFHEAMGFDRLVRFPAMGYKRGEWSDVEWWHRALGEHPDDPADPLSLAAAKRREAWDEAIERAESLLEA